VVNKRRSNHRDTENHREKQLDSFMKLLLTLLTLMAIASPALAKDDITKELITSQGKTVRMKVNLNQP
jgi:hypothetical protein